MPMTGLRKKQCRNLNLHRVYLTLSPQIEIVGPTFFDEDKNGGPSFIGVLSELGPGPNIEKATAFIKI